MGGGAVMLRRGVTLAVNSAIFLSCTRTFSTRESLLFSPMVISTFSTLRQYFSFRVQTHWLALRLFIFMLELLLPRRL